MRLTANQPITAPPLDPLRPRLDTVAHGERRQKWRHMPPKTADVRDLVFQVELLTQKMTQYIEASEKEKAEMRRADEVMSDRIKGIEKRQDDQSLLIVNLNSKLEKELLLLDKKISEDTREIKTRLNTFSAIGATLTAVGTAIASYLGMNK